MGNGRHKHGSLWHVILTSTRPIFGAHLAYERAPQHMRSRSATAEPSCRLKADHLPYWAYAEITFPGRGCFVRQLALGTQDKFRVMQSVRQLHCWQLTGWLCVQPRHRKRLWLSCSSIHFARENCKGSCLLPFYTSRCISCVHPSMYILVSALADE